MVVPQKVLAARLGNSLSQLDSARRPRRSNLLLLNNNGPHKNRHSHHHPSHHNNQRSHRSNPNNGPRHSQHPSLLQSTRSHPPPGSLVGAPASPTRRGANQNLIGESQTQTGVPQMMMSGCRMKTPGTHSLRKIRRPHNHRNRRNQLKPSSLRRSNLHQLKNRRLPNLKSPQVRTPSHQTGTLGSSRAMNKPKNRSSRHLQNPKLSCDKNSNGASVTSSPGAPVKNHNRTAPNQLPARVSPTWWPNMAASHNPVQNRKRHRKRKKPRMTMTTITPLKTTKSLRTPDSP